MQHKFKLGQERTSRASREKRSDSGKGVKGTAEVTNGVDNGVECQ